jgi:hypothetical protein
MRHSLLLTRCVHATPLLLLAALDCQAAPGDLPKKALPPLARPEFQVKTDVSLPRCRDAVVVICRDRTSGKDNTDAADCIARSLTKRLERHRIRVVSQERLKTWFKKNPNWMSMTEVGAGVEARFVIRLDVSSLKIEEESGRTTGCAQAVVRTIEVHSFDRGSQIYKSEIKWSEPLDRHVPRKGKAPGLQSIAIDRLTRHVGRLFHPHIAPVRTADTRSGK